MKEIYEKTTKGVNNGKGPFYAEIYNEKTALIGLAGAATIFLPVAPFFTAGLYYSIHKKFHQQLFFLFHQH